MKLAFLLLVCVLGFASSVTADELPSNFFCNACQELVMKGRGGMCDGMATGLVTHECNAHLPPWSHPILNTACKASGRLLVVLKVCPWIVAHGDGTSTPLQGCTALNLCKPGDLPYNPPSSSPAADTTTTTTTTTAPASDMIDLTDARPVPTSSFVPLIVGVTIACVAVAAVVVVFVMRRAAAAQTDASSSSINSLSAPLV
eukprot:gnl/Spiro4/22826_TR11253_c0_g1_i1.p1 gnl/Spiro4/22826_TR11253_c0_g1~~gnl/Spiro4/22826_TR11253_c0_g1_i1.p1  ORF type:complete len:217 (+),score=60.67 gnl/Spiro4/22826_TR11253_c0_g1_i1:49-651(+)